jgi:hypothetical protein
MMEMIPKNRKRDGTSERLDMLVTHLNDRPAQSQGLGPSTAAFDPLMRQSAPVAADMPVTPTLA